MTYHYRAYGLIFASDIELPFEGVAACAPDVTVTTGNVPEDLGPETKGRGLWWAKPGAFLIRHPGGCAVHVRNGSDITVTGQDPDMVRFMLTGSALSALLQQRGIVTLHASAVVINDRAVAFFGQSGAGKSTTATALVERGFALITDDVLGLSLGPCGTVFVLPGYPRLGLWNATTEAMNIDVSAKDQRIGGVAKFLVQPRAYHTAPIRLSHVFNLIPHIEGNYDLRPMTPSAVFAGITQNVHRRRSAMALGAWPGFFQIFGATAQQSTGYELIRPRTGARFDPLVQTIVGRVTQDLQDAA